MRLLAIINLTCVFLLGALSLCAGPEPTNIASRDVVIANIVRNAGGLLSQVGVSNPPIVFQNAGTPLGVAFTFNCSTNVTCSISSGVLTITSSGGGTTINPTNNTLPKRSSATAFVDSQITDNGSSVLLSSLGQNTCATNLLQLGGTTSAFPAICNGSGELDIYLADGSGLGSLRATGGFLQNINGTTSNYSQARRFLPRLDAANVASDYVLSAGWGSTATVTGVVGFDQSSTITVTPNGTGIAANPTITFTFHNGSWANQGTSAICTATWVGGTGVVVDLQNTTPGAASYVFTALYTPTAGATETININCWGR